jgi:hypothetical protein
MVRQLRVQTDLLDQLTLDHLMVRQLRVQMDLLDQLTPDQQLIPLVLVRLVQTDLLDQLTPDQQLTALELVLPTVQTQTVELAQVQAIAEQV